MAKRHTIGAFVLVQDEGGKLLLCQRGLKPDKSPDHRWNLSGGGIEEKDSTLEGAAFREGTEETGLELRIADHRPVGVYPTANIGAREGDVAITWLAEKIRGELREGPESIAFLRADPSTIMELAKKGDVPEGLVGGIKTSTGGVPRHLQMCLHFFTRAGKNEDYRKQAREFCEELGIVP